MEEIRLQEPHRRCQNNVGDCGRGRQSDQDPASLARHCKCRAMVVARLSRIAALAAPSGSPRATSMLQERVQFGVKINGRVSW